MAWLQHQRMLQAAPAGGWEFPEDVEGWLSKEEGMALADLATGKDVLEIGSYMGRSSICMAQMAKSLTCVDPFDGRDTSKPQSCLEQFMENLCKYGVADRVTTVANQAVMAVPELTRLGNSYDLCFIDGAHDYQSVRTDYEVSLKALRPGGLLAFHDYRTTPGEHDGRWDPDVSRVVDELLQGGAELVSRAGTVAVLKPGAA